MTKASFAGVEGKRKRANCRGRRGERGENQRGLNGGREAPNCLLQHVMTSLLHINLSLLRAISVSMQEANSSILSGETPGRPITEQEEGKSGFVLN